MTTIGWCVCVCVCEGAVPPCRVRAEVKVDMSTVDTLVSTYVAQW